MKLFRTATIPLSLNLLLKDQLRFLNQYFDVTAVSGDGKELDEIKDREGVTVKPVNMVRQISPYQDLKSLFKLYLLFRKEKPIIVHSITPKAGLLSMIAGKLTGVPIRIHTFTGLIFPTRTGPMKQLLILMDKFLCYCATDIYPEGNGVKTDLINYRITAKPLRILANGNVNGINLEFFRSEAVPEPKRINLRESLNIHPDDFVFIFIGRLVRDKGINELISAFKNINVPNTKLLLVGTFELELDPLLPDTLLEINTNANIISVGFQKDVRTYFAISDALVFPSYREGFPNVVLQAGAMELPSIVTNINGSNEIIINDKNGIIIPSQNVLELQKGMMKFATDKLFYQNLKVNARPLIVSRFEQKKVWEALLAEYNKLIETKKQNI